MKGMALLLGLPIPATVLETRQVMHVCISTESNRAVPEPAARNRPLESPLSIQWHPGPRVHLAGIRKSRGSPPHEPALGR